MKKAPVNRGRILQERCHDGGYRPAVLEQYLCGLSHHLVLGKVLNPVEGDPRLGNVDHIAGRNLLDRHAGQVTMTHQLCHYLRPIAFRNSHCVGVYVGEPRFNAAFHAVIDNGKDFEHNDVHIVLSHEIPLSVRSDYDT